MPTFKSPLFFVKLPIKFVCVLLIDNYLYSRMSGKGKTPVRKPMNTRGLSPAALNTRSQSPATTCVTPLSQSATPKPKNVKERAAAVSATKGLKKGTTAKGKAVASTSATTEGENL